MRRVEKVRDGERESDRRELIVLLTWRLYKFISSWPAWCAGSKADRTQAGKGLDTNVQIFPEKAPHRGFLWVSWGTVNVGYWHKSQNDKAPKRTWMRKSGESFEVKGKKCHEVWGLRGSSSWAGMRGTCQGTKDHETQAQRRNVSRIGWQWWQRWKWCPPSLWSTRKTQHCDATVHTLKY